MVAVNITNEAFQVTALIWLRILESQLSPELCRVSTALESMDRPDIYDALKIAAAVSGGMDTLRKSGAFKNA